MPSPVDNGLDVSYFSKGSFGDIRSMVAGSKWGGSLGTGVEITYSFPKGTSWWLTNYSSDQEPDHYTSFRSKHVEAAEKALAKWAKVSGLSFKQLADNSTTVGEIRFAFFNDMPRNTLAWAYLPNNDATAGDVWFNDSLINWQTGRGSEFVLTALHEIGHAIGLNHSFKLPNKYDNYFFTVMSYTASPFADDDYASFYPTTPMFFDIEATQKIYGIDTTTNAGNTVYKFNGGKYFETIYDAGGFDTIKYTGPLKTTISLKIGSFSELSAPIQFSGGHSSRATVAIGPNTRIEKAVGGNKSDKITGNASKNTLVGRAGDDLIKGLGRADKIEGGAGADTMFGGGGPDVLVFKQADHIGTRPGDRDMVKDFRPGTDTIDLRGIDAKKGVPGNNAFTFFENGSKKFDGAKGELRWFQQNKPGSAQDRTYLKGDINGDGRADFVLEFKGLVNLSAGDILL